MRNPRDHKSCEDDNQSLCEFIRGRASVMVGYGSSPGKGGLGHSVASALHSISRLTPKVTACGPANAAEVSVCVPQFVWRASPPTEPAGLRGRLWLRRRQGQYVWVRDSKLASWLGNEIAMCRPDLLYGFTQVSLEALQWAQNTGIETVLENPNSHIREFDRVYREESLKLCSSKYFGHPCRQMIEQVEAEYQLATRIRVYSQRARRTMIEYGVPSTKIWVAPHEIDVERFSPASQASPAKGPLRICFVGSLCLRKGFYYLLRAMRHFERDKLRLRIVGATGDRASAWLFKRESAGLQVEAMPGDPLPAYREAELLVLPTLEDGFGFVVAEAMACGLPVIVTSACGAADWVRHGETGWVIPPANENALAAALEEALARRGSLRSMGEAGRTDVVSQVARLQTEASSQLV